MDDLVTWLRAQMIDDERVAREALHSDAVRPGEWVTEHHNSEYHDEPNRCHIAEDSSGHYWTVASEVFIPVAEHMARWDPARALAEIDAKRRILELHGNVDGGEECYTCSDKTGYMAEAVPCSTVRLLAVPYAERAGYRDEWRP